MPSDPSIPEPDSQVPDDFAARLRTAYRWPDRTPRAIDEALLELARERGAMIERRRGRVRFLGRAAAVAAAAGLAMAAVIIPRWGSRQTVPAPVAVAPSLPGVAGDVNADGEVDILDALALARRIGADPAAARAGAPVNADLNVDGVVDRADVDAIAQAAVKLEGRG